VANRDSEHTVTALLVSVVNEITHLFQTELRLARAEVREKVGAITNAAALIGAGAVILLPGLVVLLLAIVRWLVVAGMAEEWSLTLVGIVVLAIGAALAIVGINAIRKAPLVPERTIRDVQADFSIAKEPTR